MQEFNKSNFFKIICSEVSKCKLCPRMANSTRILSNSSGLLSAKIMFIGEAPGRLGADSTGIPFHGDKAGDNFETLLDFVGISREDIFITNAVLCNPKDAKGNNATPNTKEINNCSSFLKRQIDIVDPKIIVTLGSNALKATSSIEAHKLELKSSVRTSHQWYGKLLIPLYHPGQRAMIHRSMSNQRSDYRFVAERLRKIGVKPKPIRGKTRDTVANVVRFILSRQDEISYFALHKLLYLCEISYLENFRERLTGAFFIRQKDGPYCTDVQILKLKNSIPELRIKERKNQLFLSIPENDLFSSSNNVDFDSDIAAFLQAEIEKHASKSNSELKSRTYLSKPMKKILKMESKDSINFYNAPICLN